jgi:hypothetical protein
MILITRGLIDCNWPSFPTCGRKPTYWFASVNEFANCGRREGIPRKDSRQSAGLIERISAGSNEASETWLFATFTELQKRSVFPCQSSWLGFDRSRGHRSRARKLRVDADHADLLAILICLQKCTHVHHQIEPPRVFPRATQFIRHLDCLNPRGPLVGRAEVPSPGSRSEPIVQPTYPLSWLRWSWQRSSQQRESRGHRDTGIR